MDRSDGGLLNVSEDFNQHEAWPIELVSIVTKVDEYECERPQPPLFAFEMSAEAAEGNFCVLAKHGLSLERALEAQRNSPLGCGSEFRPVAILAPLLHRHPNWERLHDILTGGSK